jgi:hypothetical protein
MAGCGSNLRAKDEKSQLQTAATYCSNVAYDIFDQECRSRKALHYATAYFGMVLHCATLPGVLFRLGLVNSQRLELAEKRAGIDAQLTGGGRAIAVVAA